MAVPYDYYRIFYYVARYQSFTKAALVLSASQPNITRTVNKLEQELGCRLFLRSNRGVSLTPEGQTLYRHVQIAEEQLQTGIGELAQNRGLEQGSISIGTSEVALHLLLLPVLRQFRRSFPGIRISVTNHTAIQAVSAVKSGQVDFAVISTPAPVSKPYVMTRLTPVQDILVAGPAYEELKGKTMTLEQVTAYPLICLEEHTRTREFYQKWFAEQGLTLQPDIETATTDQVLPMVRYDLGLGFLPAQFAASAIAAGDVFQIQLAQPIPLRHICLVHDKGRPMSRAALKIIQMLREYGSGLPECSLPVSPE